MQIETARLTLEVERHGPETARPLILIRGLGTSLIFWPRALIDGYVAAGFHVITFDNRDNGLSGIVGDPAPDTLAYTIGDMADDVVALMDSLGLARADMLGMSMGGMILQDLALRHSDRLGAAIILMSSSGTRALDPGANAVAAQLRAQPASQGRADVVAHGLKGARLWQSPGWPMDETARAEMLGRAYDRGHNPDGTARQLAAIEALRAAPPRIEDIGVPTLVIHGSDDTLIPVSHGEEIAARIPGARLIVIDGMGHDLEGALSGVLLRHTLPFLLENQA